MPGGAQKLEYGLKDSGAKALIADEERLERVGGRLAHLPAIERVVSVRAPARNGVVAMESIVGAPGDWAGLADRVLPDVALSPDDDASILYTSGTTGNAKGALQTHRNSTCALVAAQFAAARNFVRRGDPIPAPDPTIQRALLISIPFFHTTGAHAILCPALIGGAKIVMTRRFDPVQAMQLIERERITSAGGVPTIAWQIVEHPDRTKYDLSSLKILSYGGAPAASELVRRISPKSFPKSAPGIGWGMTETTSTFTNHSARTISIAPKARGRPIPSAT